MPFIELYYTYTKPRDRGRKNTKIFRMGWCISMVVSDKTHLGRLKDIVKDITVKPDGCRLRMVDYH